MNVSQTLLDRLLKNDILTVFGIPGTQTLPLNKEIRDEPRIQFVMARHETAVSHQAWGFSETSQGIAATLVVPGPGDMNALNGLKNALNDATPILHISVEIDPELRGGDAIHETPPETYDPVVKENILVETPASTGAAVERGISIAETAPQGPVRIGIPRTFLSQEVGVIQTGDYQGETVDGIPHSAVNEAVSRLRTAETPVIIAGGGIRRAGASEQLRNLAEILQCPVATTWKGKGVFPEDHELAVGVVSPGPAAVNALLENADVVLALGTDLDAVTFRGWSLPLPDELIHVSLHPDDIGLGYEPSIGIVARIDQVLSAISSQLGDVDTGNGFPKTGQERANTVRQSRDDKLADLRRAEHPLTSPAVLSCARTVLPRDTIVTADGGGLRLWMLPAFEALGPDAYVQPGSWASMGTALPAGIGAAIANPDRDVVAMTGDGGLLMCLHELHTVVAEQIPIVTLVCNNADYAIISESARLNFDFEPTTYGWPNAPIDFVAAAESLGMEAARVETTDELKTGLDVALEADAPRLIEVITDPNEPQALHWSEL